MRSRRCAGRRCFDCRVASCGTHRVALCPTLHFPQSRPHSDLHNFNSLALLNSNRASCCEARGALLIDAPLSARWTQDASDLYNADYAQTEELFRRLLSSSAGKLCLTGGSTGVTQPAARCCLLAARTSMLFGPGPASPALPASSHLSR